MQKENTDSLVPRLGLFTAVMIVVGSIIGSGIFKKIAPMTLKLQSSSLVLWCWFIAGIITLFGALTYAEIASRVAQTGGLYAYLRTMYGKLTAYFFGWSCFAVIQSASIASIAFVFAEAVFKIFPFELGFLGGYEVKLLAVLTILLLSTVNYLGVMFGGWVENIFTVLKVLGILIVAVLAFAFGRNKSDSALQAADAVTAAASSASQVTGVGELGTLAWISLMFSAMLGAFWAFDGLNNVGFLGGEIKKPKKNIPLALIFGVTGILGIYMLVNASYFLALPISEIINIAQTDGKIFAVEMIDRISGAGWALFVSVLIMVSTFGATNASVLSSARIYYVMAIDGIFFKSLGRVHEKFKTPSAALVAQALWSSVLVFSGSFDDLTDMLISTSFIFYGLGAYGLWILRKKNIGEPRFRVPSFVPALYVVFCAVIVASSLYENPKQALTGIALTLAGLPIYLFFNKAEKVS